MVNELEARDLVIQKIDGLIEGGTGKRTPRLMRWFLGDYHRFPLPSTALQGWLDQGNTSNYHGEVAVSKSKKDHRVKIYAETFKSKILTRRFRLDFRLPISSDETFIAANHQYASHIPVYFPEMPATQGDLERIGLNLDQLKTKKPLAS